MNKNKLLNIKLMLILLTIGLLGCNNKKLVYVYDIQKKTIIEIEPFDYNKPGLFLGNRENISYCNSNIPYFISTQVYDRENSGFIILKRNYAGKIIDFKNVILGNNVDYSFNGGFCVNADMTKGAILSYPKEYKFNETINMSIPYGIRDVIICDFCNNSKKIIANIDGDKPFLLEWLDNDNLLLCKNRFEDDQSVSIINITTMKEIELSNILTKDVDFYLSSERNKIFYRLYEDENRYIIKYYDILDGHCHEKNTPINEVIDIGDILKSFLCNDYMFFLGEKDVMIVNLADSTYQTIKKSFERKYFSFRNGIATHEGIFLFALQYEENSDNSYEKYFFISSHKNEIPQSINVLDNMYITKMYIGYRGRYILLQR